MISTLELTKAASQKEGSHYGATKGSDATEGPPADATHSERFRDNLFAILEGAPRRRGGWAGEPRRRRRGISITINPHACKKESMVENPNSP